MLQILLLGPPRILQENGSPPPNAKKLRRRERAALYLLAASEAPLSRDHFLNMLWDGVRQESTQQSLSSTLSRLKAFLPKDALKRVNGKYCLAQHPDLYIDYREFVSLTDDALKAARHFPNDVPLPPHIAQRLQHAATLWKGRFLEGFRPPKSAEFDNWLVQTANHLDLRYQEALQRLAYHYFAQQNYAAAFSVCQKALDAFPDQAQLLLLALRALRVQGQITAANKFLQSQRERLTRTLGTDYPEDILQQARQLVQLPNHSVTPPSWSTHRTLKAPFIGRADILETLRHKASRGGAHLLLGETGQGKTRLLEEFARQMVPASHRLVRVTCHHGDRTLPFAPLLDATRNTMTPEEWRQVNRPWWPYMLHLFPEAEKFLPPGAVLQRPPAPMQRQLMEVLRLILLTMARSAPLLVCVDDVQWSDPATADTLLYWMERPPFTTGQAFLVMTARRETFHESPFGQRALPLLRERRLESTELEGFTREEVRALAESMLERPLDANEVDNLWRGSIAGTPLYLLEILRYQIESGEAHLPVDQWPLPQPLMPLLEQRLHYLTPEARTVLEYAALQGNGASRQVFKEATGLSDEELTHALEMLEETRWLQSTQAQDATLTYDFVHHKLSEAVLSTMSATRKQIIHQRLAGAWKRVLGQATQPRAAVIARHYQHAGEHYQAMKWWVNAAHHALKLGVAQQAHEAFHNASKIVAIADSAFSDEEIWSLYAEWMLLAYDTVDVPTLKHIIHALSQLANKRQSPLLRSSLLNAQAYRYHLEDNIAESVMQTRQALVWLESLPEDMVLPRIETMAHHAHLLYLQMRAQEARQYLQAALEMSQGEDSPLTSLFLGNIYYQLAALDNAGARPDLGLENAERSLQHYHASRRVFGIVNALGERSLAHFMLGHYDQAMKDCNEAIERAELFNKKRALAYLHTYCAFPLHAIGRLAEAWERTERALELSEATRNSLSKALALRVRGTIHFFLEDWENALRYYTESLQATSDRLLEADLLFRVGIARAHLGEIEQAMRDFEQATAKQTEAFRSTCLLIPLALAEAHIVSGRYKEAAAAIEGLLQKAQALERFEIIAGVYLQQARIDIGLGNRADARKHARLLAQICHEHRFHWLERAGLELLAITQDLRPEEAARLQQLYDDLARLKNYPELGDAARKFLQSRGITH